MLNLIIILVVSVMMIIVKPGVIEINKGTIDLKDGKATLVDAIMVEKDGKVDLKKGAFVIKEGSVDQVDATLVVKAENLTQKDDKTLIKSSLITEVEKDGAMDLKTGAVVLKENTLNVVRGNISLYVIAFIGFWLCLGGWLAIAPAATATFYGMKNYARNYGVMFFAYGIGAIIGGIISGQAKILFGSYTFAFYPTAALAVIGIILSLALIKAPQKK